MEDSELTGATGGETTVGGVSKQDIQTNDRVGVTLALPAGRSGGIKLIYTNGLSTRLGADFDSWSAAYQRTWGRRGRPRPATPPTNPSPSRQSRFDQKGPS